MNRLQVALVSPLPPPYGGIAHWTRMIYEYSLSMPNVEITVIDTAPRWRAIHDLGVWRRIIGGGFQLCRDVFRLASVVYKKKIKVVHLTTSGDLSVARDLLISLSLWLFRTKFIYHIRFGRVPEIAGANSLEWRVMKWVMRRAAAVIAIDAATFDAIQNRIIGAKVILIPNCVDVRRLPSRSFDIAEYNTVVFLGWVVPSKGIDELIDAWAIIKSQNWKLKIIGPIEKQYLEKLMIKSKGKDIEFLGELPHEQAMDIVAHCGLFVLPSYSEGFPNVVVEAMALARPIVATRVGAIPEMLAGGCGLLIDKKNHRDLASAMSGMMGDETMRKKMGGLAYRKAMDHYTLDVIFQQYVQLWESAERRFICQ